MMNRYQKECWYELGTTESLSRIILYLILGLMIGNLFILGSLFRDALIFLSIITLFTSFHEAFREKKQKSYLFFLTALLGCIACLLDMGLLTFPIKLENINFNWITVLLFVFGIVSAFLFSWKLVSIYQDKALLNSTTKWRYAFFIPIITGIYIAAAVVDHWWFFRDSTSVEVLSRDENTPIFCDNYLIIRFEKNIAKFRCMKRHPFTVGIHAQPFSPWPDYRSGEVEILKEKERVYRGPSP